MQCTKMAARRRLVSRSSGCGTYATHQVQALATGTVPRAHETADGIRYSGYLQCFGEDEAMGN